MQKLANFIVGLTLWLLVGTMIYSIYLLVTRG